MANMKFFYNGIKANGGKLESCYFNFYNNDGRAYICVNANSYGRFSEEIRNAFRVQNDTDTMTDYFEKDHFTILPGTEYWKSACEVCIKSEERRKAKEAKRLAKCPNSIKAEADYVEAIARIDQRIAEIKKAMEVPVLKIAC